MPINRPCTNELYLEFKNKNINKRDLKDSTLSWGYKKTNKLTFHIIEVHENCLKVGMFNNMEYMFQMLITFNPKNSALVIYGENDSYKLKFKDLETLFDKVYKKHKEKLK